MGMKQQDLELLDKYEKDLMATLSLTDLLPHLTQCRLLTSNDAESLSKPELTRRDAIKKFLLILKTKGQTAFSLFISALGNEKEHLGHASLYRKLTCEVHDHAQANKPSVVKDNEPHPLTTASIRQSTNANSLCSDSGISQSSSSATSGSAASVGSVALSNGMAALVSASMQPQLDFIKDQIYENSRNISELAKKMEELSILHTRTSSALSWSLPRRQSFSSLSEQMHMASTSSETSSRHTESREQSTKRLTRSTTCSFPIIKQVS